MISKGCNGWLIVIYMIWVLVLQRGISTCPISVTEIPKQNPLRPRTKPAERGLMHGGENYSIHDHDLEACLPLINHWKDIRLVKEMLYKPCNFFLISKNLCMDRGYNEEVSMPLL